MAAAILRHPPFANGSDQRIPIARCAWLALSMIALACNEAANPDPPDPTATTHTRAASMEWRALTPLLVGNQLRNPGFEADAEGWGRLEDSRSVGFEVVGEPVHSGRGAALLVASWRPGSRERPVAVRTVAQEISPPRFPDRIAGWYRVDRWDYASEAGGLQLQIIVAPIGDPRTVEIVRANDPEASDVHPDLDNYQLRYQLAGPTEDPEDGGNIKNRVIGTGPPELGSWVHFDLPVKSDFERAWGTLPADYRMLRILFAVRWDDKPEGAALHADVYYDDLFFGFDDL